MARLYGVTMNRKDYRAQSVSQVEKIANTTGVHLRGVAMATQRLQRNAAIHPNAVGVKNALGRLFSKR